MRQTERSKQHTGLRKILPLNLLVDGPTDNCIPHTCRPYAVGSVVNYVRCCTESADEERRMYDSCSLKLSR